MLILLTRSMDPAGLPDRTARPGGRGTLLPGVWGECQWQWAVERRCIDRRDA